MDVTCQSCRASYKVDDAKIPAQGIKAKCPKCGHSFFLKKPDPVPPPSDDVIAVGGDAAPPPPPSFGDAFGAAPPNPFGAAPAPAPDPFASIAPPPDPFAGVGAAPPPDPFGGAPDAFGGAPAPDPFGGAPAPDPFAGGGFGGAPDLGSFKAPAAAAAPDPFAAGGVFGGGFMPSAPAQGAADGIGGLFQAKTAFEVRKPDGSQIGPFDLFTLKQMIYEQQLNGSEELLDAAGNWVPIATVEDLGEILRLTGASAASADGGAWGAVEEEAAPGGWAKHESVASPPAAPAMPPPPAPAAPASIKVPRAGGRAEPVGAIAPPPAPPIAIEPIGAGKRGASEALLIGVERVWALTKKKSVRIVLGVLATVAVLSGTAYLTRGTWMGWFGLDKMIQADAQIAIGAKTAYSGEKGPLLTSLGVFEGAVAIYPGEAVARLAETQAAIVWRDPTRLDLKAKAEANIAASTGATKERAALLLALASHDAAAITAALAAVGEEAEALHLKAEAALEKGDLAAAEAGFTAALGGPAAAQANVGLARVRVKKGDFAAAKSAADAAVAAEPDNGLAKALAAFTSAKTGGDAAAAKATLLEILGQSHRFPIERAQAARFLSVLAEEQGAPAGALSYAAQAVALYPADADAVAAAKRLFAARFPDKPVDAWIAAISKVRGSTQMGAVLDGERMIVEKNWPGAQSALRGAVGADPNSARAHVALARLLLEIPGDSNIAEAKKEFAKAISLDGQWAEPAVALAKLEFAAKNHAEARKLADGAIAADPTRADAYQAAAAAALALKDAVAAEQYLRIAVELDPDSPSSWMDLGEALRLMGRPDEAIPHLEKAAGLAPKLAEPRIRLGAVYETKADYQKAGELYAAAAALEPENLKVATRAGVTLVKAGDMPAGKKRLEVVVKAEPSNAEAQYWLGIAHQFGGDPEKAVDDYRAAIKHKYDAIHEAHLHLGELFAMPGLRDADAARDQFRKAIEAKADFWQARIELAKLAESERQFDEALKELKLVPPMIEQLPAAEKRPILERVLLEQGRILKSQGKGRDAQKTFNDVLKVNPRSAEALNGLGELLLQTSTSQARAKFEAARAARRDYAPPYKHLADLDNERGNCRSARANYTKFMELSTDENAKKEVEGLLRDLPCE